MKSLILILSVIISCTVYSQSDFQPIYGYVYEAIDSTNTNILNDTIFIDSCLISVIADTSILATTYSNKIGYFNIPYPTQFSSSNGNMIIRAERKGYESAEGILNYHFATTRMKTTFILEKSKK